MEEKQFDILINEIKDLKGEMKILNTRMDVFEEKLEKTKIELKQELAETKEELRQELAETKVELKQELKQDIKDVRIELKRDILGQKNELVEQIQDFKEINTREHTEMIEYFQSLYQESKKDRKELHQNVNDLSAAHKLNRMDIDKLMSKC